MIFVKNTTSGEYEPIAFANSHTLSKTLNTKELASKDFGDASAVLPQNYSWTMQTDNLYSLNGYRQLNDIFRQMRRVKIYFGESSYKQYTPQNSIVDKNGAVDWMTDGFGEEGFAYITSLDVTATAGENATFTATFTGTGPLTEIESGYSKKYLTFEALEDTTFTFTQNALQYSLDNGTTWTTLPAGTATPTVTAGNKILWKQTGLTPVAMGAVGIGTFSSSARFNVSGNIMSLYYGDNFANQLSLAGKTAAFAHLFYQCSGMENAHNLVLPATTLADYCYLYMFGECSALTSAPAILPATTLTFSCYGHLFDNCINLINGPEIPDATPESYCYDAMYRRCRNLHYIKCMATDLSATGCTMNWVSGVAATGTFVKAASMSDWPRGDNGIPNNWNIVDNIL